ncbi:MAG TPA: hypothetical protein VH475_01770 [Tepidisphaeraceae bacterium]
MVVIEAMPLRGHLPLFRPFPGRTVKQKRKVVQNVSAQNAVPVIDQQELPSKGFAEKLAIRR